VYNNHEVFGAHLSGITTPYLQVDSTETASVGTGLLVGTTDAFETMYEG
jgi:hypothetical protein